MKFSRALKYLILLMLLSLTLSWKVLARATFGEQPADRNIQVRLAEFLVGQHFSVSLSERVEEGKPAIVANAGACRMLITSWNTTPPYSCTFFTTSSGARRLVMIIGTR